MKMVFAIILLAAVCGATAMEFVEGVSLRFLSGKESGQFLSQPDDFIKRLSPYDRSVSLRVARDVSEKELLAHVDKLVLDWTYAEYIELTA